MLNLNILQASNPLFGIETDVGFYAYPNFIIIIFYKEIFGERLGLLTIQGQGASSLYKEFKTKNTHVFTLTWVTVAL